MTLFEVAQELSRRLTSTSLRDANGRRPVYGGTARFQDDPHWRDLILFYECLQGDNGAGLGASHQTGWTGLTAALLDLFARLEPEESRSNAGSLKTGSYGSRWAENSPRGSRRAAGNSMLALDLAVRRR